MHMKRSQTLKINRVAVTLCTALLLLPACSNEIEKGGDSGTVTAETVAVTFSVNAATGDQTLTTKGMTEAEENTVRTLYILAFQPDPAASGAYKLKYNASGTAGGSTGQFSFTLRRSFSGADTRLLLVANFNPFASVRAGMTYDEVQTALKSGELAGAPAFTGTGIPMFGFAGDSPDTPLNITEGMTPVTANLLRAVARVDVGVGPYNTGTKTWDKGSIPFNLTDVIVYKPYNRYALLPEATYLLYTAGGMPSVTAASQAGAQGANNTYTGDAITSDTYCQAEIYLPEVALAGSSVYDDDHERRTALVIGGYYNGSLSKSYYRIDFTTARTNEELTPLHDILRNRLYRYSITGVTKPGYTDPDLAYAGKGVDLLFTMVSITAWDTGTEAEPQPNMLVRMDFDGENGTEKTGAAGTILAKKAIWTNGDGKGWDALDYNALTGEVSSYNAYTGYANGGCYPTAQNAFDREGPAPKLVVAPDNAGQSVWKNGSGVLAAKQLCRDYRGQGRTDWRLPRLSELYLLWCNRGTIENIKGFTSLGSGGTYWSASEKADIKATSATEAWTVNAAGEVAGAAKTSTTCWVRCVREIR